MKKIFIPFLVLIIISCSEPVKLSVYNVTINYDELNSVGSGFILKTRTDTIHSLNDSTAYAKALFKAEAQARGLRAYKASAKVHYFQVSDSLENSLGQKLGLLKIEEINKRMTVISQETKEKFLY